MSGEYQAGFVISARGLNVLAAACGTDRMLGFAAQENMTPAHTIETMGQLVREGMLRETDSGLKMEPEVAAVIKILARAEKALFIYPADNAKPQTGIFVSGEMAGAVLPCALREDTFSVYALPAKDLYTELERLEVLPELPEELPGDAGELSADAVSCLSASPLLELKELKGEPFEACVETVFELYDAGACRLMRRLIVFRAGAAVACGEVLPDAVGCRVCRQDTIKNWLEENVL